MIEELGVDYFLQNGFAIAVALYLLYERSRFNQKIMTCLVKVSETLDRLEENMRK